MESAELGKPNGRRKVGIDLDGTLALFHEAFISEYNNLNKTKYVVADFSSWSKWKIPISFQQFDEAYNEMWTGRWATIRPSIDESMLISLMEKFDVDIITHRPKDHEKSLHDWLSLYFPNAKPGLGLRITDTSEEKASHGHDFLLDDAPPLAEALIKRGESKPMLLLITRPWNRQENYESHSRIIRRAESVNDAIKLLIRNGAEPQTQSRTRSKSANK
jgi:5'(3')-deoxyribonucleotidase